jgi:uracil-DNA glycosylase family 4
MFTGDSSGDFLYRALYKSGFASQPESRSIDDGLRLHDAYISAAVRCAPPDNKPLPSEIRNCRPYLERDLELLRNVRVVLALGRLAFDEYRSILVSDGKIPKKNGLVFAHGAEFETPGPRLIASYHPSQQNTFTGKLTEAMFDTLFTRIRRILSSSARTGGAILKA